MEITVFNEPNFIVKNDFEIDTGDYPIIFETGDFINLYKDGKTIIIGDSGGKRFIVDEIMSRTILDSCLPILNNFESLTESVEDCDLNRKIASLKVVTEPINILECKQCKSVKLLINEN